jgi:hypothetical protein
MSPGFVSSNDNEKWRKMEENLDMAYIKEFCMFTPGFVLLHPRQ